MSIITKTLGFLLLLSAPAIAQQKRPNIIFIFSDDHAFQAISAYGGKLAQTPNIDRIAREGAIFHNAVVTNSICGPSRATLLTGKYSHMNGYKANEGRFDVTQLLFPRVLQQNNYQTAWIGKWHLGSLPDGFDYWRILPGQGAYYNPDFIEKGKDTARIPGYVSDLITNFSVDWLQHRDTSKPFFLVVGHKATHREWFPDLQDLGAYDDVEFPLPGNFYDDYQNRAAAQNQDMTIDKTMRLAEDLKVNVNYDRKVGLFSRFDPEQKEKFSGYYQKISRQFEALALKGKALVEWKYQRYLRDYLSTARSLDRNVGRLLQYLDETGLAENTVVVYASDQGFYMGEHGWFDKRFMYEESLRTPFVVRYPGVIKPGTKVDQLMSNIDWAPTMLDIAGVKPPAEIQGRSFMPLVKTGSKNPDWRKAAYYHYYEYPEPHRVYPHFGVRTAQYTLVHFYGQTDSWELYDLKKDPTQMNNLYGDKQYAQVTAGLKQQLRGLIKEYKDDEALKILDASKH
ncbi:sulfatase [Chitinophaga horti]|uniref:Sulfatase n=1 Tax=Chitinophaga horti TaxID=2920382 RepID=A0ABY6J6P4_9BACT|nr:sulfatase [Chitinophaga horti]UYQ95340.1 sulfatase [Chitinophaga horti]